MTEPAAGKYDPICIAKDARTGSIVEIAPTAVRTLSISVTDHSSTLREPKRLWGFIDAGQAIHMRDALDKWLRLNQANRSEVKSYLKDRGVQDV